MDQGAAEKRRLSPISQIHRIAEGGWVLSDWGGTHSTAKAAMNGLDQEMPGSTYFGDALKKAVESGEVPLSRLNDMVHRILRSMFAVGVIDNPPVRQVPDVFRGLDDAQHIAEECIVLLKNANNQLPLNAATIRSIAVIGGHSDVGVPSGGGSSQSTPLTQIVKIGGDI
jgi:beta-glucosidase